MPEALVLLVGDRGRFQDGAAFPLDDRLDNRHLEVHLLRAAQRAASGGAVAEDAVHRARLPARNEPLEEFPDLGAPERLLREIADALRDCPHTLLVGLAPERL